MRRLSGTMQRRLSSWATMCRITIQPSEKSIPPDFLGTLPSKTSYYIWRAHYPSNPSNEPSAPDLLPKAILILQHDHAEYARRYLDGHHLHLFAQLREQGIEIWAFDVWGHGLSRGTRGVWDVQKAVADHLAVRKLIADESPEKRAGIPVFAFGHGYGGLVTAASLLASESGLPPIAGVILSAPIIDHDPMVKRLALTLTACFLPHTRTFADKIPLSALSRDLEQVDFYLNDPLRYDGFMTWRVRASSSRVAHRVWKHLNAWNVPMLLINGTEDVFISASRTKRFFARVAAADKRHQVVEGGKHEVLRDLGHEKVEDGIVKWLEEHLRVLSVADAV